MEQTWLTCGTCQARPEVRTIPTWEPMCAYGRHSHLDIHYLGRWDASNIEFSTKLSSTHSSQNLWQLVFHSTEV